MSAGKSFDQTTLGIVWNFLFSSILTIAAWWIWPTSLEWYGFGLLSIMTGAAGLGLFIAACRGMFAKYQNEKVIYEFETQGGRPKSSRLGGRDEADKGGLL